MNTDILIAIIGLAVVAPYGLADYLARRFVPGDLTHGNNRRAYEWARMPIIMSLAISLGPLLFWDQGPMESFLPIITVFFWWRRPKVVVEWLKRL